MQNSSNDLRFALIYVFLLEFLTLILPLFVITYGNARFVSYDQFR